MSPSRAYYEYKREREEERRQKELQRRKEETEQRLRAEEKERQREEERREEARREAQEFQAALEKARLKREEMLSRLRQQKLMERKETGREMKRRDELLAALREANREKEREEARKEQAQDRKTPEKETPQTGKRKEAPQEPLKEKRETLQQSETLQERRKATLEEQRKEAATARKLELQRQKKNQSQKKQTKKDEIRQQLARERLEERKKQETGSQTEEKRRAELIKERAEELLRTQRAEERKSEAIPGRKGTEGREEKEAQRREEARRQRLDAQKQERGRNEKEATRKAHQKERRSLEKETRQRLEGKEERPKTGKQAAPTEKPTVPRPLESRLPSGVLSGSLPWLLTYDNRVVTTEGEIVFLRGINLPSLDEFRAAQDAGPGSGAERISQAITEILSWGANSIRLGISHASLLQGGASSMDYLELLDGAIERASAGNCYTVVYLLEDPGEPAADVPYLSNLLYDDVVAALRILAERYASEPALLLDLGCPPRDLMDGETPSRQTVRAAWNGLIPNLVADLRLRHPRAFCFVGGLDRATDITGFPVTGSAGRPIPGLVYRASIYPGTTEPWTQLKKLSANNPVFVSEWGGASMDAAWGERVAVMMETMSIGWAAAFWTGEFALVRSMPGGRIILTPFGTVVKRALAFASQRAEASQLTRFSITM
jgi:hypothetical protein